MDRQTLRDWVHRYNAAGLAGLRNLKSLGHRIKTLGVAASRIGRACRGRSQSLGAWGRALAAGRSARRIAAALRVTLHERSVGKVLAKLGYRKLSVRPRHPQLTKKPRRHLKKLRHDSHGANPRPRQRQAIEIWFQDEARSASRHADPRLAKRERGPARRTTNATTEPTCSARPVRTSRRNRPDHRPQRRTMSLHLTAIAASAQVTTPLSSSIAPLSHRCRAHHPRKHHPCASATLLS